MADFFYEPSQGKVSAKWAGKMLEFIQSNGDTTVQFQELRDTTIRSTVPQIRFNLHEIEKLEANLEDFLTGFHFPLTSMNGIETVTAKADCPMSYL